jgi:hypothetical protein
VEKMAPAVEGQPRQRVKRRALCVAFAFGMACALLFMYSQLCLNVVMLRHDSQNAFLAPRRKKWRVRRPYFVNAW